MAELQRRTGIANLNGTQLAYEIVGTGHPLVLVHAGIADMRMWDDQIPAFAEHYQVIRYDARGYGKTSVGTGPIQLHEDLHALLTFLGVEHAYLLGCSMGGQTIIDFALEHPQMVDALIPVGSGLSGYQFQTGGEPPKEWAELEEADERGDLERVCELEVHIWVDGLSRTPEQVDPIVRKRVYEMNMTALVNQSNVPDDVEMQVPEPPAIGRLAEIHVPTLVIIGDLDLPKVQEVSDLLAGGIPGAQKVVMHGTAHVPSMEQPAEFNQVVLDFLAGVESSRL
jgi:pimeloyl-ACP methyl ester carboxylesterase